MPTQRRSDDITCDITEPGVSEEAVGLTLFLKECALIGSSAANEQLLRMMKTRMRLVKMW